MPAYCFVTHDFSMLAASRLAREALAISSPMTLPGFRCHSRSAAPAMQYALRVALLPSRHIFLFDKRYHDGQLTCIMQQATPHIYATRWVAE